MSAAHDQRVTIITGASAGLGLASAEAILAQGGRVVLVGRDAQRLDRAIAGRDTSMRAVVGDLAEADIADRAIATALDAFGRVDAALISVGGPLPGSVLSTTDDAWLESFRTIFLGSIRFARTMCAALGPGGAIGLVLSTSAREVFPGLTISNGLRPGLAMLVKDLADEVGPSGIRVIGLMPGRIETDRIRNLFAAGGPGTRAATEAAIPLRRIGDPAEFGEVAAFLLGPAASYVTGCVIPVDGGALRAP